MVGPFGAVTANLKRPDGWSVWCFGATLVPKMPTSVRKLIIKPSKLYTRALFHCKELKSWFLITKSGCTNDTVKMIVIFMLKCINKLINIKPSFNFPVRRLDVKRELYQRRHCHSTYSKPWQPRRCLFRAE